MDIDFKAVLDAFKKHIFRGEKNPESEGCYLNKILTKLHTTFWKKSGISGSILKHTDAKSLFQKRHNLGSQVGSSALWLFWLDVC